MWVHPITSWLRPCLVPFLYTNKLYTPHWFSSLWPMTTGWWWPIPECWVHHSRGVTLSTHLASAGVVEDSFDVVAGHALPHVVAGVRVVLAVRVLQLQRLGSDTLHGCGVAQLVANLVHCSSRPVNMGNVDGKKNIVHFILLFWPKYICRDKHSLVATSYAKNLLNISCLQKMAKQ